MKSIFQKRLEQLPILSVESIMKILNDFKEDLPKPENYWGCEGEDDNWIFLADSLIESYRDTLHSWFVEEIIAPPKQTASQFMDKMRELTKDLPPKLKQTLGETFALSIDNDFIRNL